MLRNKTIAMATQEINSNFLERRRRIAGQNTKTQETTTAIVKQLLYS